MYPYRIIQNSMKTQKFLLTEDLMIGFNELIGGDTASRLNFMESYSLSRTSMKKVFKLRRGRIGSRGWSFEVFPTVPAIRIGCMRFEGSALHAIKAWIADRR